MEMFYADHDFQELDLENFEFNLKFHAEREYNITPLLADYKYSYSFKYHVHDSQESHYSITIADNYQCEEEQSNPLLIMSQTGLASQIKQHSSPLCLHGKTVLTYSTVDIIVYLCGAIG